MARHDAGGEPSGLIYQGYTAGWVLAWQYVIQGNIKTKHKAFSTRDKAERYARRHGIKIKGR